MCRPATPKSTMQTDEILDMISCTARKQRKVQDDLRLDVLLKSTHKLLRRELRRKQRIGKKKWAKGLKTNLSKKPPKYDNDSPITKEDDAKCFALLGLDDFFNNLKSVNVPNSSS